MDKNKFEIVRLRMERTAQALRDNNMYCECADNTQEALEILKDLIEEDDTVTVGGSMTLFEAGVIDFLRDGQYEFLDRYEKGISAEQLKEIYRKAFFSDVFITSTNAVIENGELYNVDGNGNRVAAMIYGPESVIVIAGYNKIVKDLDEAKHVCKALALLANAVRLGLNTPCTVTGKCMNCKSESRICSRHGNYGSSAHKRPHKSNSCW